MSQNLTIIFYGTVQVVYYESIKREPNKIVLLISPVLTLTHR